jgi:hypothetical protein
LSVFPTPDLILGTDATGYWKCVFRVNAWKHDSHPFSGFWVFCGWEQARKHQLQPIWDGFGDEFAGIKVKTGGERDSNANTG